MLSISERSAGIAALFETNIFLANESEMFPYTWAGEVCFCQSANEGNAHTTADEALAYTAGKPLKRTVLTKETKMRPKMIYSGQIPARYIRRQCKQ